MELWQWGVIVLLVYSIFIHRDNFMDNPIGNIVDGAKQIINEVVNLFSDGNAITAEQQKVNFGKPLCSADTDCNTLSQCTLGCQCIMGECYG